MGRGGLLGDDMGLGKTLQAIAVMWALLSHVLPPDWQGRSVPCRRALVLCPASLVWNWELEFKKWATGKMHVCSLGPSAPPTPCNDMTLPR